MRKYITKCHILVVGVLLAILSFIFAGCTTTAENTATYEETVDGVLWAVTYNTDTSEVVSIKTPLAMYEFDKESQFYNFMAEYTGNPDTAVVRSTTLVGKPVGGNVYKIEQTEAYKVACSRADYEVIKATFPACVYSETPYSYELTNPETGEVTTVTTTTTEVTLTASISTYELTIVFNIPTV